MCRLPLPLLLGLLIAPLAVRATQTVAYEWNTVATYDDRHDNTGGRWQFDLVDGRLQVTLPPDTPENGYYNYFVTPSGTLTAGQRYTAVVTFQVTTPTDYPNYFYLFARNTSGNQYDLWQQWIGEPGATRTIAMPLDLPVIGAGTWTLYMGTKGPGALIVDSLVIYNGTPDLTELPVANGIPASSLPAGVTAATGYTPFTPAAPATGGATISMADYDFTPDSTAAAATNASQLQQAINDCKAQGASRLIIPAGTYYLAKSSSIGIDNLDDFTLDGQGSTLVFRQLTGDGCAILQQNCDRIVIKNLILDWDWSSRPIASLGVVSNLSADRKECDFTFPDLDAARTALTRVTPWTGMFPMDPTRLVRATVPGGLSVPGGATISATATGNVLHAAFPSATTLANGETCCIRHLYYEMACFKVLDNTDLTYDSVQIRSMPGMGWLFESAMHDWQLVNCAIQRAPGSRNPLTTAADGIHVTESEGNLIIKNCTFTGCGDDVINLHDTVYQGVATPDSADPAKLVLTNCPSYRLRLVPGDVVQFYDADYGNLNAASAPVTRTVAGVTSDNSAPATTITFTQALPSPLTPQAILRNTRFNTANVRIAGCQFLYTNGHGILLSTQDTTVENCYFRNIYSTPIQFEANIVQPLWSEGKGASNIVVRNNTFENNNQGGDSGAASIWAGTSLPWGPTDVPVFDTLLFEGNRFFNSPGPILSLNNCSNVIARSNRADISALAANATSVSAAIVTTRSSGLALGGNTWVNWILSPYDYGVVYDPGTTANLSAGTNTVTSMIAAATEDFETYADGATFTTGQTLGSSGSHWAGGWRTANSLSTGAGAVTAASPLDGGQRLGITLTTQAGKTASCGAVGRAYTVSGAAGAYAYAFRFRPDTLPANLRCVLFETRSRAAGPDSTTTWQIATVNGTWQLYDGAAGGGPDAYVDTGLTVAAGTACDFTITLDPAAHTWGAMISDGSTTVTRTGLHCRSTAFDTDPTEAPGGRWLDFGAQEILSGPVTVGATGAFSLDGLLVALPPP